MIDLLCSLNLRLHFPNSFHSLIVPPASPEHRKSFHTVKQYTTDSVSHVWTHSPLSFHTRIVLSSEPLISEPLHSVSAYIARVCPLSTLRHVPVIISQTLIVLSSDPLYRRSFHTNNIHTLQ